MPRFEDEGYNPRGTNRNIDRTVPKDENYYKSNDDLLDIVRDRQERGRSQDIYDTFNKGYTKEDLDSFRTSRERVSREPRARQERPQARDTSSNRNQNRRPQQADDKKKKGKSKKKKKLQIIIAVILILAIILPTSAIPVLARINYRDKHENEYISSSSLQSDSSIKNILLLGVDARSNDESEASRSDTMMIVSVDSKHHCIKLVSFLRDTWVHIPSLGYEQRLNAACSSGGYQNVADTIEYNFGVKIDGYVVTDFEMFKILVDSIGGVKIDVTEAEAKEVTKHKKRYGHVVLEEGKHNLTGEQALAYCRIRKIDTDFVRTQRQRTVITAIIKKAVSNPTKLYKMAYNAAPYLETSLSKGELMGLVGKVGGCAFKIYQTSVPFDGTWEYANKNGNSVIAINREKNRDMLREYIYDLSSSDIKAQEAEAKDNND